MSLERIKTFEKLSPNVTSMLDVSNGMNLLSAPWQDPLPDSTQTHTPVVWWLSVSVGQ